uniref:Uncharacterized protein n=1 Tax=Setaria digitata TaxID=48799 RepID=A0A915Q4U5_9BILA
MNFDESVIQKSTNLKIEKAKESDLSKNTFQKTLASYQQPILIRQLVKRPDNGSEVIGKQLMTQKTLEESNTKEQSSQESYKTVEAYGSHRATVYYPPDNEEDNEKPEMHKNPLIGHPSIVTFPGEMMLRRSIFYHS